MQKNCLKPGCNRTFDSIRVGEIHCPACREQRAAQKVASKQDAEAASASTPPLGEGQVQCLSLFCNAVFQFDGHNQYCPACSRQEATFEVPMAGAMSNKSAKVCLTPECKQIFYSVGEGMFCPLCERILNKADKETEDEAYEKIKDYLMGHQHATVDEIHVATKVSIIRVKKMLDEGRFQLVLLPKCKQCNGPIVNGRPGQEMCVNCVQKLRSEMLQPFAPTEVHVNMHTQNNGSRSSSRGGGEGHSYGFGR